MELGNLKTEGLIKKSDPNAFNDEVFYEAMEAQRDRQFKVTTAGDLPEFMEELENCLADHVHACQEVVNNPLSTAEQKAAASSVEDRAKSVRQDYMNIKSDKSREKKLSVETSPMFNIKDFLNDSFVSIDETGLEQARTMKVMLWGCQQAKLFTVLRAVHRRGVWAASGGRFGQREKMDMNR